MEFDEVPTSLQEEPSRFRVLRWYQAKRVPDSEVLSASKQWTVSKLSVGRDMDLNRFLRGCNLRVVPLMWLMMLQSDLAYSQTDISMVPQNQPFDLSGRLPEQPPKVSPGGNWRTTVSDYSPSGGFGFIGIASKDATTNQTFVVGAENVGQHKLIINELGGIGYEIASSEEIRVIASASVGAKPFALITRETSTGPVDEVLSLGSTIFTIEHQDVPIGLVGVHDEDGDGLLVLLQSSQYPKVIRLSLSGEQVWTHRYKSRFAHADEKTSATALLNLSKYGIFLIMGQVGSSHGDPWVMELRSGSGEILSESTYPKIPGSFKAAALVSDGLVFTGDAWAPGRLNEDSDLLIIKIGVHGQSVWTRLCGGSRDDAGKVVAVLQDGSLVFGGSSKSKDRADPNPIESRPWVLELDSLGSVDWEIGLGLGGSIVAVEGLGNELLAVGDRRLAGRISRAPAPLFAADKIDWSGPAVWHAVWQLGPTGASAEGGATCIDPVVDSPGNPVKSAVRDHRL